MFVLNLFSNQNKESLQQMIKDAETLFDNKKQLDGCEKILRIFRAYPAQRKVNPCLFVMIIKGYKDAENYKAAKRYSDEAEKHFPDHVGIVAMKAALFMKIGVDQLCQHHSGEYLVKGLKDFSKAYDLKNSNTKKFCGTCTLL